MKQRVLVVDDETSIRTSLKMILDHAGYEFLEASSGQEALDRLSRVDPDVIILDIKMPGMDGLEVLEALKRQDTKAPVIVVSGHGDIETAVKATKLGAFNFIEKPFGEQRVLLEVRNAIEQGKLRQKASTLELEHEKRFEMIGRSAVMEELRVSIGRSAPTQATVLIVGESGTGKELVARAIHRNSGRKDQPFVRVNCAAIPEDLIESELFGHERGSFTGASGRQIGKFLQADHGTLFLDEVGDMSPRTQAKVLRALETGEIEPVGAARVITVDVRVIAATNKDLEAEIQAGRFREDLYFRLAVVPIHFPPLRARQ
ncbi:MAG: sigma-54-dependent transcriptional regulator, partial [Acidobacteriota bacterium]